MSSDDEFADVEILVEDEASDLAPQPLVAPAAAIDDDTPLLLEAPGGASAAANGAAAPYVMPKAGAFTATLAENPTRARHIALLGFTQHGKSALAAELVGAPLLVASQDKARRITTRCTVQAAPIEGTTTRGATLLTCVDTPGHPSFVDEALAGLSLADAAVVCIDAAEGLHPHVEALLRAAVRERARVIVAITKVDRYLADMRLPPKHAHEHLVNIVTGVNNVLVGAGGRAIDPVKGELLLISTRFGLCVSIPLMASKYAGRFAPAGLSPEMLARRLWGQVTYSTEKRAFVKQSILAPATFVTFVLEPLYKVFSQTISGDSTFADLDKCKTMSVGIKEAVRGTFGTLSSVFIDAVAGVVAAPVEANSGRVSNMFTGEHAASRGAFLAPCPLLMDCRVTSASDKKKAQPSTSEATYAAVVKVAHGTLTTGAKVVAYHRPDAALEASVSQLLLPTPDGLLPITTAKAGTIVLACGPVVNAIEGHAVLMDPTAPQPPFTIASKSAASAPTARVAVEPVKPEHTSTFKEALKAVTQAYAGCTYAVEETGEHTLHGPGELFLDSVLHDLRSQHCTQTPIRVSDPFVSFAETVAAPEGLLRVSSNQSMNLAMTASSMGTELGAAMDAGIVTYGMPRRELETILQGRRYGWDELQAEGLFGFGPDAEYGPNTIIADTLDTKAGADVLAAIAQGFRTATARGPLCGAPMRDVRFSLSEVEVPVGPTGRIPRTAVATLAGMSRQLVKTTLMSAAPRLMEPVALAHVVSPASRATLIAEILGRRRGKVLKENAMDATPLSRFECIVPLVDSFGMETEVRQRTEGDAHVTLQFDHWAVVPGDPLDQTVQLLPLQAASGMQLARDFVAKTRRRHGLADVVELL